MILGFICLFYVFSEKILYDLWFEVERVSIYFIAPELCPQIDDILLCASHKSDAISRIYGCQHGVIFPYVLFAFYRDAQSFSIGESECEDSMSD